MDNQRYDVVVVGGGPAGSTLASFVAMRGHRVLLLEKEFFPRYQIGESLLPSTVHGICRMLGVADAVEAAGFTRKRGGTFRWGASPQPWTFEFATSRKVASPTAFAYQVERMKFDQILLDNSRRLGVDVREGCLVKSVVRDGEGRVTGVRYTDASGPIREVDATFVVDAAGNTSRLHKEVGERTYSEYFRNIAVFGYFNDGVRLPAPHSGNIFCEQFEDGWFWYIPLSPTLTSVGAVVHRDAAERVQRDPEGALLELVKASPIISEYLRDAERVIAGPYGRVRVRKDWSYTQNRFWQPGMVLVGDAACFIDPVFSSGVHLATYSALQAARAINSVVARAVPEPAAFTEYERRYRREFDVFYRFLRAFYALDAPQSSYFWEAKRVIGTSGSEPEAFVELVGGMSSGESALLGTGTGEDPTGFATAIATADGGTASLSRVPVVAEAMSESAKLQALGLFAGVATEEEPLFADGLGVAEDGLQFVVPAS